MSNDELELPAKAAAPKKKKGKLIAIVAVVLLLVLGGAGYMFLQPHKSDAKAADSKAAKPAAKEFYLPLEPAFVVNFTGDESVRFLQVGVTLMAHDNAALDAAKDAQPVVRNALVMLFSGQTWSGLNSADGKQKLQAQALVAVQKIVKQRTGKNGVDALYFTSFVMQ